MAKHVAQTQRVSRKGAVIEFGSRTDIGCVREQNEDSLVVKPPLFVVADGMGGHAAGEIASEICVKTIEECAPEHPDAEALSIAVEEANRAIINAALSGEGREGMGTTCTAAMIEGENLVIAQVGDSRAYLLHAGSLIQLTRDHSLMANMIEAGQITAEEARYHPHRSVITRALGNDPDMVADLYEINVEAGDRLLLCSDGLTGMLPDAEIEKIMRKTSDPQRCAAQLVNAAIEAGGLDNITVIVANVTGLQEVVVRKTKRRTRLHVIVVLLLLAALLAGAGWGGYTYLHNTAYLANDNGMVAIYRGVPGEVFGFSYSEHVETTDIAVADLPPSAQVRINESMRVNSVEEATNLVATYRADIEDAKHVNPTTGSSKQSASSSSATASGNAAGKSGMASGTAASSPSDSASSGSAASAG